MKRTTTLFVLAGALLAAAPALAATDYFIKFDGVDGESSAAPPVSVDSWSFGTCSAGQCVTVSSPRDPASGQAAGRAAGKGKPTGTGYDLATNKGGRAAAGGVNVAVGDVDGDGRADLAFVATQDQVSSFTLTFQKIPFDYRAACKGKHIPTVRLSSSSGDEYVITDAAVTCSGPRQSSGRSAVCTEKACDLSGPVTMTITGGSMKHTKSGHVTLLK